MSDIINRFRNSSNICPICGGHDRLPRGHGERCSGYLSDDGEYAFCTREEKAGSLELRDTQPPAYKHKLHGPCNCGVEHNADHRQAYRSSAKGTGQKKQRTFIDGFTYDDERAVAKYHYYDTDGQRLYTVVRYQWPSDDPGKKYEKDFRPFRWEGREPIAGIKQVKERVLYNEPALRQADKATPVYWVESEKSVDKLKQIGLLAVCTQGGAITGTNSAKWNKAYAEAVRGRNVFLLADNDDAGEAHVKNVATYLKGIAASVRIVRLPDLPPKGDVYDWLEAGGTREQLEAMTPVPKSRFKYASDVKPEPVNWLWKNRIARGMGTLVVGDPGLGKGATLTKVAAAVTRGGMLPDNHPIEPGGVILMSPEDSEAHTIVPRLIAAGADLTKIILLSKVTEYDEEGNPRERPITFPGDAPILEEAIKDCNASLAIIDPVMSMIDMKYDAHKDQAVRFALGRVLDVAEKQGCAVVGVMHLNKGQSSNALYRSGGSIGFIGLFRVGLFFVTDPDNKEGGVIVNHKNNLASKVKTKSLCYSLCETNDEMVYIEWTGESSYTQDQLLNQDVLDNPKSEKESELITILKNNNNQPMSPEAILAKLTTGQSRNALDKMLDRKVQDGVILRVSRGMYTYKDNPSYTEQKRQHQNTTSDLSDLSDSTATDDAQDQSDRSDRSDVTFNGQLNNNNIEDGITPPVLLTDLSTPTRPPRPTIDCGFCGPVEWLWSTQEHDYLCPKCFSPFAWTLENNQNAGRFLKALK